MGDETNPNDKLRMVLDYMPCAPCKEIPSDDQKYLCTICKRLNRTVARKCAYAAQIEEPAAAAAAPSEPAPEVIIQGDKVFLTKEEWDRITAMLGSTPASEDDKKSGMICITRSQWDEILDKIEQKWEPPKEKEPEIKAEEPEIMFSEEETAPKGSYEDLEDIEVVVGKPRPRIGFEPEPSREVFAEEVKTEPVWTEGKFEEVLDEQSEPKYVTGVKVFSGPNVDEEIRKWAEEHGAIVKGKIPIKIRQKQN